MINRCPKCKSDNVVNIIYGEPSPSLLKRSQDGEVELGGCIIDSDSPRYKCKSCMNEFGRLQENKMKKIYSIPLVLISVLFIFFVWILNEVAVYRCDSIIENNHPLKYLCKSYYFGDE
jgi:hypothetical protein